MLVIMTVINGRRSAGSCNTAFAPTNNVVRSNVRPAPAVLVNFGSAHSATAMNGM